MNKIIANIFFVPSPSMQLSDCLTINADGLLIYTADRGIRHEVIGGTNGLLHLRPLS